MPPIVFADVTVSLGQYRQLYWQLHRGERRLIVGPAVLAAYLLGVYLFDWPQRPAITLGVVAACSLIPLGIWWLESKRIYAQTPLLSTPTTFRLNEQGFIIEPTSTRVSWARIRKVWMLRNGWVLESADEAWVLPLSHLQLPATAASVNALLWAQHTRR